MFISISVRMLKISASRNFILTCLIIWKYLVFSWCTTDPLNFMISSESYTKHKRRLAKTQRQNNWPSFLQLVGTLTIWIIKNIALPNKMSAIWHFTCLLNIQQWFLILVSSLDVKNKAICNPSILLLLTFQ